MLTTKSTKMTVALLLLVPVIVFAGQQFKLGALVVWALAFAAVMAAGIIAINERYQSGRIVFLWVIALALIPLSGFVAGLFLG